MLTKSRMLQLLIMLCVLVALVIWRTIDLSVVAVNEEPASSEVLVTDLISCDFMSICVFKSPLGEFKLSVDEGPIKAEQWFNLTLQSDVDNWHVENAKIVGKSMFMGKIPVKFSDVVAQQSRAKTMLAACAKGQMVWQLKINVIVGGLPTQLIYDFTVLAK